MAVGAALRADALLTASAEATEDAELAEWSASE